MARRNKRGLLLRLIVGAFFLFALATFVSLKPTGGSLSAPLSQGDAQGVLDRNGVALSVTYQNRWNSDALVPLHAIPPLLQDAFLLSEDRNFYTHGGVDWRARMAALVQNFRAKTVRRGASTITEQAVRLVHPRPRNLWSKWLETWEAMGLERHYGKARIFEFYLNQLPYMGNRRGVLQASRSLFGRDLDTLTEKEMLALAVLARAPSAFDPRKDASRIEERIAGLAELLQAQGKIDAGQHERILQQPFAFAAMPPPVNAMHFIAYARAQAAPPGMLRTTLDAPLQAQLQELLDARLEQLAVRGAHNGAAVVLDHVTGEILAWVVTGANSGESDNPTPGWRIDAVTVPRQPGSALKPFLYAQALDKGMTAASIIEDAPLEEAVGVGLHRFNNYSRIYYGPVSLREALGNSLNIPAVRTIVRVGVENYLQRLKELGFESLTREADIYDEGLALGNGEVTLLEMARAYAALANRGVWRPLHWLAEEVEEETPRRVYSEEAASLIGNILSDPYARRLEFGAGSVLNLPVQTAVKTGTSTDYRDAWAMGYNHRYVVGVWIGNLDHSPMKGVTGALGPALVLRGMFAKLNERTQPRALYLSPKLVLRELCGAQEKGCSQRSEYFAPGTGPEEKAPAKSERIEITRPTEGLNLAVDPRIPRERQRFLCTVSGVRETDEVTWKIDGEIAGMEKGGKWFWAMTQGKHTLSVEVRREGTLLKALGPVRVWVK